MFKIISKVKYSMAKLSKGKKIAIKIALAVAGLALTLYCAFWGMLIAAFSGETFFAVLVPLTIVIFFVFFCLFLFKTNKRKNVFKIFLAVLALIIILSASKIAYTTYDNKVPVVSVMDFDLKEYMPLEGMKRVVLDRPASLKITNNFPVFDGAVALFPIYAAFAEVLNPNLKSEQISIPRDYYASVKTLLLCSNTPVAYSYAISGIADIIFVAAPSQQQIEEAKDEHKEFKLTPIGKEAFVFFVNKANPIDDLTLQQVKDIYSGRVKNWKKVGGNSQKIKAFQRPEGSGSQTALEKLMKGDTIMKAPSADVPAGMGGMIKAVAEYKNYRSAIGFSFRFFVTGMMENQNIKLLKIEGVYPSKENIENGAYPLSSEFYAVTAGSKNPNVKKVLEWMLSPQGQEIVEKAGYTPIKRYEKL